MDWSKGYRASYYMTIVDRSTMRDVDRIELISGSIKRSLTDLRESATLDCKEYDSKTEQLIRVWLDTKQEGGSSHTPLFTGLATSPDKKYTGRKKSNTLECYSVLKFAEDVMLPRGWYAPIEANGGSLIRDLLQVIGLPRGYLTIAENAPALSQSIIAESGENHLSMVDQILTAMNWRMKLDGLGRISIGPVSSEEVARFDANDNDIIETEISISYDWYSAPNVLRCTLDDAYAEARDEDPNSPLSIQNRGREVWYQDEDVSLTQNETLAEYTQRMLKEYQKLATNVSYTRRFVPGVYPGDVVRISYPAQEVNGRYLISEQSLSLGYNCRTSEEVIQV